MTRMKSGLAAAMGIAALAAAIAPLGASAEVINVSPVDGATLETLPDAQLAVLEGRTRTERLDILKAINDNDKLLPPDLKAKHLADLKSADKKDLKKSWRRNRPLTLVWKTTEGEKGPWRVRLAKKPDFSDAKDLWLEKNDAKKEKSEDGNISTWTYTVPRANLELGATYYWEVWSNVKCGDWSCGYTYPDGCKCGKTKAGKISRASSFTTSVQPPRWISVEGRTGNIRDIGGWVAEGGRRVRLGMAYRGEGLNDNSVAGVARGRNRLTVEDVDYLTGELGIKTDLDLRSERETADMAESPLGAGVKWVHVSSACYGGIFGSKGKEETAENFRLFCDEANYPIYFHCIGGADRTGSLAYILNGLLGVSREDLERDWEETFYPSIPGADHNGDWRSASHFDDGFAKYGAEGDTLQRRIELYLADCGITEAEMAKFRSIMLPDAK